MPRQLTRQSRVQPIQVPDPPPLPHPIPVSAFRAVCNQITRILYDAIRTTYLNKAECDLED